MSGRPARSSQASPPRILVVDGDTHHEVFEVIEIAGNLLRARSAFLFEVGEELNLRIEHDDDTSDTTSARVRAHTGPADAPITELEIADGAALRGPG